jgi:hypothetical protein
VQQEWSGTAPSYRWVFLRVELLTAKQTGVSPHLSQLRAERASVEDIEVIYRESFHRFVRVAQAITRSRESAIDVVQEASHQHSDTARVTGAPLGVRC